MTIWPYFLDPHAPGCMCPLCFEMREEGLEPSSRKAPDPKSHFPPDAALDAQPKLAHSATEIPPDATSGTTAIATRCRANIALCRCSLEKGHEGQHLCDGCGDPFDFSGDFCDGCGRQIRPTEGRTFDDKYVFCRECADEATP